MDDLLTQLTDLKNSVEAVAAQLDIEKMKQRIAAIEAESGAADFWNDDERARSLMQELASIREDVESIESMARQIDEHLAIVEMLKEEPDDQLKADLTISLKRLYKKYEALELRVFLSEPYDAGNALLSIHAGQGGVDAQDWAGMMQRMYQRYVERMDWKFEIVSESWGEDAGIKSVTLHITGRYAYGYLKREQGTHRLVRLSPFNADNLRQTSFALVEVLPEIETSKQLEIPDSDIEWSFFRSSGKGGQNVNKVSTAVRLKHLPSGIVVESQAQRTQVQNRSLALSMLQAKLWAKQQETQAKELAQYKGGTQASWGTQIRSYVLHPYQLVKDMRTEVETNDTSGVLDGDLELFIQAGLRLDA